jgi:hypothetical protein
VILFPFILEAVPVLSVTLAWFYRSKRKKLTLNEYRRFAETMALLLCTYSALALAVLSELQHGREPDPVNLSSDIYLAHLLVSLGGLVLAIAGYGRVRVAALIAGASSASLWYMYSVHLLS